MIESPTRLVAALTNPDVYPHPCVRVEVIETHISWVFLTGLRAYKIKKPVCFSFVDFSTLAERKRFCEEELRLNRRVAPELYLDVVAITGTPDAPEISGRGPVIDYAVRMRQFEKEHVLSHVMAGELTDDRIDGLADDCAALHNTASVAAPDSVHGSPQEILTAMLQNFEVLEQADSSTAAQVADLRSRAGFHFSRLIHTFKQRRLGGRVRECHGDLHLGNMFLQGGRVTIFDGIEFNDSFRWIDVANDIAFLIMDLEDRGYTRQAKRLLNRWLERTGDYDALKVLPFYCSYRAAVRAKIEVLRMHDDCSQYSAQRHQANNCRHYMNTAHRYMIRLRPSLTITMGPSGSGKTTVTQRLIESSPVIRIRSDVERKRMHGLQLDDESPNTKRAGIYSADTTVAVYDRLATLAETIVEAGFPVVVDATFLKSGERESFARLADCLGVPFTIIRCQAPENVLRNRIRQRNAAGRDASEADDGVLDRQLIEAEGFDESASGYRVVSATDDLRSVLL